MSEEKQQLKIIITTQSYYSYFDLPAETIVKEFNMENGNDAELYYLKQKEQADKSGGMMHVGISIVQKAK